MSERTNTSILHGLACLGLRYSFYSFFFFFFSLFLVIPSLFATLLYFPFHIKSCFVLQGFSLIFLDSFSTSSALVSGTNRDCCQRPLILIIFFILFAIFLQLVYFTDNFQTYLSGLHLSHFFLPSISSLLNYVSSALK